MTGLERNRRGDVLLLLLALGDSGAIALALVTASILRYTLGTTHLAISPHLLAGAAILPAQLVFFRLAGLYDLDEILGGTREYGRIAAAATYNLFLVVGVSYFVGGVPLVSRLWLLLFWALVVFAAGSTRFIARRIIRRARRGGRLRTRVLVVGASAAGVSVARELARADEEGIELIGFVDEFAPLGRELLSGIRVIGRPADLARNPTSFAADEYVLVGEALPHQRLDELVRALVPRRGASVRLTVGPPGLLTRQTLVAQRLRVSLVALRRAEIVGFEAVLKRALDIAAALVGLVLLTPLALAAVAVAAAHRRRPLLRVQHVYGREGTELRLPLLSHGVSRLLPVRGAPALLGVLAGRLSIVGPRPQPRDDPRPPLALQLTAIKPGLTGRWRLSGVEATLDQQATEDLTYVRSYTPWEDLRIVWETLRRGSTAGAKGALARWQTADTEGVGSWPISPVGGRTGN